MQSQCAFIKLFVSSSPILDVYKFLIWSSLVLISMFKIIALLSLSMHTWFLYFWSCNIDFFCLMPHMVLHHPLLRTLKIVIENLGHDNNMLIMRHKF